MLNFYYIYKYKMNIHFVNNEVLVLSHELYINDLYKKVLSKGEFQQFKIRDNFFNVIEPFKTPSNKSIPKATINEDSDVRHVQRIYQQVHADLLLFFGSENHSSDIRQTPYKFSINGICNKLNNFEGGNTSEVSLEATVNDEDFLIPCNCHFYNYDIKDLSHHINEFYDFILLDPPWWNKYIRRKRTKNSLDAYNMMWNNELADIPIGKLLKEDGLVAVWCTNAQSHITALHREIFPRWGVQVIAQWFWLKVTKKGEVVTPFSSPNGKQPFERIFFGVRDLSRSLPNPEPGKLLVSVPSVIHSHKPPLCNVVQPFLPPHPKKIEIFARYLLPNCTSYGNEVLKLQHKSLFQQVPSES